MAKQEKRKEFSLKSYAKEMKGEVKESKDEEKEIQSLIKEIDKGNFSKIDKLDEKVDELFKQVLENTKRHAERDEFQRLKDLLPIIKRLAQENLSRGAKKKVLEALEQVVSDARDEYKSEKRGSKGKAPKSGLFERLASKKKLTKKERKTTMDLRTVDKQLDEHFSAIKNLQKPTQEQLNNEVIKLGQTIENFADDIHNIEKEDELQEHDLVEDIKKLEKVAKRKNDEESYNKLENIIQKIDGYFKNDLKTAKREYRMAKEIENQMGKKQGKRSRKDKSKFIKSHLDKKTIRLFFHSDLDGMMSAAILKCFTNVKIKEYQLVEPDFEIDGKEEGVLDVCLDVREKNGREDIRIDHHSISNHTELSNKNRTGFVIDENVRSCAKLVANVLDAKVDTKIIKEINDLDRPQSRFSHLSKYLATENEKRFIQDSKKQDFSSWENFEKLLANEFKIDPDVDLMLKEGEVGYKNRLLKEYSNVGLVFEDEFNTESYRGKKNPIKEDIIYIHDNGSFGIGKNSDNPTDPSHGLKDVFGKIQKFVKAYLYNKDKKVYTLLSFRAPSTTKEGSPNTQRNQIFVAQNGNANLPLGDIIGKKCKSKFEQIRSNPSEQFNGGGGNGPGAGGGINTSSPQEGKAMFDILDNEIRKNG